MLMTVHGTLQEARAAVKQIVDRHRQARGQQEAGGATGNTLVDTTYALGSFIAQAAIGGAELPTILQEEEVAYSAQSAVMPLRQLAASTETGAEKDALTGDTTARRLPCSRGPALLWLLRAVGGEPAALHSTVVMAPRLALATKNVPFSAHTTTCHAFMA